MGLKISAKRTVRKAAKWLTGDNSKEIVLIRGLSNVLIDDDSDSKLQLIRNKFNVSRSAYDQDILDEREMIYDGTHSVDKNINNANTNTIDKQSNQPYNLAYELLESQVDNSIPLVTIKSKRPDFQYQAKMIENSLKNDILDTKINKINDKGERTAFKQGFTAVEIFWNPQKTNSNYNGEIELRHRHPKTFVPQVGVWDIDLMDYFFTQVSTTKQQVWQDYGVELTNETEQYPQVNTIADEPYQNNLAEKVTVITCWYKDSEGDIGKFTWCMNKVLEDYPKYFYRRPMKCDKCGAYQTDSSKKCECGGKFKRTTEKYEVLAEDKILKRTQPVIGPDGKPVIDPQTGQPMMQPIVIPAGTEIPYYTPKSWPLICRVNVPSDFGFGGVSDVDVIRDKYMSISKLMNNIEEKALRNPVIVTKMKEHKITIQNAIYQVIEVENPSELACIQVLNLQADISRDLQLVHELYQQAKNLLGVTNAWQGQPDTTAKSGLAKQIQIAQSSGRMKSKEFNKFDFYKQLYYAMFEFKLAFYDELRPVVSKDDDGSDIYFDFDKYEFLLYDEDLNNGKGGWYYNTDFIFTIDNSGGWERNRDFMYQQTMQLANMHAFDPTQSNVMMWQLLDNLNFPNAGSIKQQLQMQMKQQQEAQQAMMQPQQDTQQGNPFQALTDQLSPEELKQLEQNPEAILQELMGGNKNG